MVRTDRVGETNFISSGNNSNNILGILVCHLSPTETNDISKEFNDESLEECIRLDLFSVEMRTSLISSIVLRDICIRMCD